MKPLETNNTSISSGAEESHATGVMTLSINCSLFSEVSECSPLFPVLLCGDFFLFSVELLLMLKGK